MQWLCKIVVGSIHGGSIMILYWNPQGQFFHRLSHSRLLLTRKRLAKAPLLSRVLFSKKAFNARIRKYHVLTCAMYTIIHKNTYFPNPLHRSLSPIFQTSNQIPLQHSFRRLSFILVVESSRRDPVRSYRQMVHVVDISSLS